MKSHPWWFLWLIPLSTHTTFCWNTSLPLNTWVASIFGLVQNKASLIMSRHLSSYFPVLLSINPGQDLASQIVCLRFYRSYQFACQGCWCVAVPSTMSECSNVPTPLFFWLPMAFQRQTCGQVWSGPEVLICTSLMTSAHLLPASCTYPLETSPRFTKGLSFCGAQEWFMYSGY